MLKSKADSKQVKHVFYETEWQMKLNFGKWKETNVFKYAF